jgi:SAM-dependent methyltransferase
MLKSYKEIVEGFRHRLELLMLSPPVGLVRFGSLRRLEPVSRNFGFERGTSITRYYINDFLGHFSEDIKGTVLEIANDNYTIKFGGKKVTRSEILHLYHGNPKATIIADLSNTSSECIPSDTFDCIIFTQTLQMIYDFKSAIRTLYRILKPGGVILVTAHGISNISKYDNDRWGEYWRFTSRSIKMLFQEVFPSKNIEIKAYGNVLTAISYLEGLSATELKASELKFHDPIYEVLIGLRARKND